MSLHLSPLPITPSNQAPAKTRRRWQMGLSLLCILLLAACAPAADDLAELHLGSLWAAQAVDNQVSWTSASTLALEQHDGFILATTTLPNYSLLSSEAGEGNQQDDVQKAIRNLVEDKKVVAMIGSGSNTSSQRAASLANFFNVPMIIPSADGSNLLPSNNLWAFRLSAPAESYPEFVFGSLLAKSTGNSDSVPLPEGLKVAIVYEQNTFGESAAVASARQAMAQGMVVTVYRSFTASPIDPDRIREIIGEAQQSDVSLVYVVSSEPANSLLVLREFGQMYTPETMPVIVGQAGGFASPEFYQQPESQGIYIVRQRIDTGNCPGEVNSLYMAQNYAAVFLINTAVQRAKEQMPPQPRFVFPKTQQTERIVTLREEVRNKLKLINESVPCMGMVAFDNTGQNRLLELELMQVNGNTLGPVSADVFRADVVAAVYNTYIVP